MCGIELVKSKSTKEKWPRNSAFVKALERRMNEKGLLTRVWEIVHVAPPLVVTKEEIDRIVTIIDEALTETEAEFASEISD